MAADVRVETLTHLDDTQTAAVRRLVESAADADGVHPLSEHVALHLRHGGDAEARNLLAWSGTELAGYAHLDLTDAVEGASAELVVDPAHRRHGIGTRLVETALSMSRGGSMRLWAHGSQPGAGVLAERLGFRKTRVLWQMRRSLHAPLPTVSLPADVTVRTFVVGQDEAGVVEVNNRAFAEHPDQRGWTVEDIQMRVAEPWFDPAGFFLAERDGDLVGFHWTKVHGDGAGHDGSDQGHAHAHAPIGEVYVVGVDPAAQGQGLGPALTLVGLRHLRARGLPQAMLYVDEVNTNAIRVYERLGFTRWDTDVLYRR